MLRAEEESIDIQMTHEIAKARWIDFDDLPNYKFTRIATNMVNKIQAISKSHQTAAVDLKDMPVGDLFRDSGFSKITYDFGN